MQHDRRQSLAALRRRLEAGTAVYGVQHNSGSAAVIELLGALGVDFVIIDGEHSAYGLTEIEALLRATEVAGVCGLVRVEGNDPHQIARVLDAGAVGVLVPHVTSVDECRRAVAAARYRPVGRRGKSGMSRAADWATVDWDDYAAWANTEPLVVPIIEDVEAVPNLEEIVRVDGVAVVALGPGDLSQGYGEPTRGLRCEPVAAALDELLGHAREHGRHVMTIPAPDMSGEFVTELVARGVRLVWWGADLTHLAHGWRDAIGRVDT